MYIIIVHTCTFAQHIFKKYGNLGIGRNLSSSKMCGLQTYIHTQSYYTSFSIYTNQHFFARADICTLTFKMMIFDGKINWTDSRDFFFFFYRVCSGNFPGIVKILPPLPCQQHWAALVVQKKEGLYTRNVLRTLKICGSDIKTGVGLKWILKKKQYFFSTPCRYQHSLQIL